MSLACVRSLRRRKPPGSKPGAIGSHLLRRSGRGSQALDPSSDELGLPVFAPACRRTSAGASFKDEHWRAPLAGTMDTVEAT